MASIHHDRFASICHLFICLSTESELPQTACHGGCQTSDQSNVCFWCWPCSFLVVTRGYQHHPGWILELCGMQLSKVKFSKRHDDLGLMAKLNFQVDSRAFHHEKRFVVVSHGFPISITLQRRIATCHESQAASARPPCIALRRILRARGMRASHSDPHLGPKWCCF